MKRLLAFTIAAMVAILPLSAHAQTEIAASGAALIEASSGRILYEKDAGQKLPMASTTKIMTCLLAIENGEMDAVVTVPDAAYGIEGSSMYLQRGERLLLSDLLYGLMLTSGNDAAVAIAHHISGSVEAFVALMNRRAEELGCVNTHFVTPNGLHDAAHYTTAADLCKIAAAAMKNETFRTIVSTTYHETELGDRQRTLKNKNKILWQYEGGNGVKTGYTRAAGRCLVFSAERDGMQLIGVVLNCPDMWNVAQTILDNGFRDFAMGELIKAGDCVASTSVVKGTKKELAIFVKTGILYPLAKDGSDVIEWTIDSPGSICAPIAGDSQIGQLTLFLNGEAAVQVPLVAGENVPAADLPYYIGLILEKWTA